MLEGENTRNWQKSRPIFLHFDFEVVENSAQVLQHAERGEGQRAGQGSERIPSLSNA